MLDTWEPYRSQGKTLFHMAGTMTLFHEGQYMSYKCDPNMF